MKKFNPFDKLLWNVEFRDYETNRFIQDVEMLEEELPKVNEIIPLYFGVFAGKSQIYKVIQRENKNFRNKTITIYLEKIRKNPTKLKKK